MESTICIELLLSLGIILTDQSFIRVIESAALKREGKDSLMFLFQWHALRVLGLLAAVAGVLFVNKVNVVLFTGFFITFYLTSMFYKLYRYGTTIR